MKIIARIVCVIGLTLAGGCVSPLLSDDPEVRKQAMGNVTDQRELFCIAMDVALEVHPMNEQNRFLKRGGYADDVRIMAVEKLSDAGSLLRCAAWQDGDRLVVEEMIHGGKAYRLYDEHVIKVHPGDAVRAAAKKRLKLASAGKALAGKGLAKDGLYYRRPESGSAAGVPRALFPLSDRTKYFYDCNDLTLREDSAFFDPVRGMKKNNPYDMIMSELVDAEDSHDALLSFLVDASAGEVYGVIPNAYGKALGKMKKMDSETARKVFGNLYPRERESSYGERYVLGFGDEYLGGISKNWLWPVFRNIADPDAETVKWALSKSDVETGKKILESLRNPGVMASVYGGESIVESVAKEDRREYHTGYGHRLMEFKGDAAVRMLGDVKDQAVLVKLAHGAELFSMRAAAINRIADEKELGKIASGEIKNCPYDTSLPDCGMFDTFEWMDKTKAASKLNLQKLAVSRMKDVGELRKVRTACKTKAIKDLATTRLAALGYSDVGEICGSSVYSADLFTMIAGLKTVEDLKKVSQTARLKGVRIMAARQLDAETCAAVAKQEAASIVKGGGNGKISIDGYRLGMGIEDMFTRLSHEHPAVKPRLYLDNDMLCIAGEDGRDIAWANNSKDCPVHWITLPPAVVKRTFCFKSGTFMELERAIERKLGVDFTYDVIRKGEVRQTIGNYESTEGETLRFFRGGIGEGEDFARSIRKAVNRNAGGIDPIGGGFGAALANAFEDAKQADENRANARSPRFQPQGSIQLLLTKNAAKGTMSGL